MTRLCLLLLLATACGSRETYIPKTPDPADFGIVDDTADTGIVEVGT